MSAYGEHEDALMTPRALRKRTMHTRVAPRCDECDRPITLDNARIWGGCQDCTGDRI